jgi:hypothetical protein
MSALFDPGREGFADGSYNWLSGDFRVMLVKSSYVFDASDKFLADLGSVDNGRSSALAGKSCPAGVCDANDTSLAALGVGASNALIVFLHTGSDATARLVAYIDDADGLPATPAAGQIVDIAFDNGPDKIFKL